MTESTKLQVIDSSQGPDEIKKVSCWSFGHSHLIKWGGPQWHKQFNAGLCFGFNTQTYPFTYWEVWVTSLELITAVSVVFHTKISNYHHTNIAK